MALIERDPGGPTPDYDEEGEDRDQFHIEQMIEEFVDEPPIRHDVYPESEDDGDDGPVRARTNMRRGNGELFYKQAFFNGVAFKEAVLDYVLKTGRNLKQYRYDKAKIGFKCVGVNDEDGSKCEWKVYASILSNDKMWRINRFIDKHSCIPNGECEMLTVPHIARLFVDKIRDDPEFFMPRKIEEIVKADWKISITRPQCQAARKTALKWIEREYDEQFHRLRDYAAEIMEANPNSHVEVECITDDDGKDMFNRFYVCFDNIRRTWMATCRPIIGIDGCFLKNKIKGQLLVALGRDANNGIYPIAWGVVKVENYENWLWFAKLLKEDFVLNNGDGFILMSDRQKGLIKAASVELPKIEHQMCVQHIYGNLKKAHGNKTRLKPLLWNLAWSYNESEYRQHLERIFAYDSRVYSDVMRTNPKSWCRAFHKVGNYCEDVDNNSTESFNSSINKAREKPFVAMLETIRRLAMVRIAKRSAISNSHTGICTPYVVKFLAAEHKAASTAKVSTSTNGTFEVKVSGDTHRVCLKKMTCTCQKWQICGIPCEHAYGLIIDKKLTAENYVCQWFRTAIWRRNYEEGLTPQRSAKFWPCTNGNKVYAEPPEEKQTKADKKRKKGVNESPTKKQPKQKKRIMHCGICGEANHNSRFHKSEFAQPSRQPTQPEPSQGSLTQA
ncbi:PREDICTED: uncharacterized protein LOC104704490 [Camelina sativa]|uniref:Uncharacterized protein LOC104704490 n=2 Tax=Camelina sativa TaxID=90675 RepID=A0ABM0T0E8_CAMSA|nr:PREDICTED: uncharacterized protein LOC104704490 [Camelina sativa]